MYWFAYAHQFCRKPFPFNGGNSNWRLHTKGPVSLLFGKRHYPCSFLTISQFFIAGGSENLHYGMGKDFYRETSYI
jgi:hypothetical protein